MLYHTDYRDGNRDINILNLPTLDVPQTYTPIYPFLPRIYYVRYFKVALVTSDNRRPIF